MIKIILILIGISVVFSTGFTAGATWNYIHITNKQIECIDRYLEEETRKFKEKEGNR
jgi:hypothetical protein